MGLNNNTNQGLGQGNGTGGPGPFETLTKEQFEQLKQEQGLHVVGIVGFSGQWDKSKRDEDPTLEADYQAASALMESYILALRDMYGDKLVISSGATTPGVPGMAYDICEKHEITAMGVACSKAFDYELGTMKYMIVEGDDWGQESPTFLATSDEIVMLGGGGQSKREAIKAGQSGKKVTVFRGFKGTADELEQSDIPNGHFLARDKADQATAQSLPADMREQAESMLVQEIVKERYPGAFDEEALQSIGERLKADEDFTVVTPQFGSELRYSIHEAHAQAAKSGQTVILSFNEGAHILRPDSNPEEVYEEWAAPRREEAAMRAEERKAEEKRLEEQARKDYAELPQFFKDWVDRCGDQNYGFALDVFIAKDAALIAETLKTPEAVLAWGKEYPNGQEIAIDNGHSGFSFGQVIGLAAASLREENIQ